jgi:uncharacterized membrane protein
MKGSSSDPPVRLILWIVLGSSTLALLAGYSLKTCPLDAVRHGLLCYSDLRTLFVERVVADVPLPYVHGGIRDGRMLPGSIEYPVLTGLFAWSIARFVSGDEAYLLVSAILLAPFGLVVSYMLARMSGWRALLWATSPSLILYAFLNWDLLVVAAVMAGLWLWWQDRLEWAAVAFSIGASLKLYPLLFLLPLVLDANARRGRRSAMLAGGVGLATLAVVNLPFLILNAAGWLATYRFQQARPASDSVWLLFPSWSPSRINFASTMLILASVGAAVTAGHYRLRREGSYPFLQVSAALVTTFILWNKVYSPQYSLWVLPFLALLRVNVGWWIAYGVVDSLLMGGLLPLWAQVSGITALLLGVSVAFLRADHSLSLLDGKRLRPVQPGWQVRREK